MSPRPEISWHRWSHPANHEPADMWTVWEPMIEAWRPYISPGDHCLDIGAYTGDTTIPMAVLAGPAGQVLAFEANEAVIPTLAANITQHDKRLAPIGALHLAADTDNGERIFHYSDPEFCNGGQLLPTRDYKIKHRIPQTVRCTPLRAYIHRLVQFIKIDTEGNDHRILLSCEDRLREFHPTIQTEIYPDLTTRERLAYLTWLRNLGYRLLNLDRTPVIDAVVLDSQLCDIIATTRFQPTSEA